MYAWEKPFAALVSKVRKEELSSIFKANIVRALTHNLVLITERTTLFITLLACVLLGVNIDPQTVFSLVLYYNALQVILFN